MFITRSYNSAISLPSVCDLGLLWMAASESAVMVEGALTSGGISLECLRRNMGTVLWGHPSRNLSGLELYSSPSWRNASRTELSEEKCQENILAKGSRGKRTTFRMKEFLSNSLGRQGMTFPAPVPGTKAQPRHPSYGHTIARIPVNRVVSLTVLHTQRDVYE